MVVRIMAVKEECGVVCKTSRTDICDKIGRFFGNFIVEDVDVIDDPHRPIYGRIEFHTGLRWLVEFDPDRITVDDVILFITFLWEERYGLIYNNMLDVLGKPPELRYIVYMNKDITTRECEIRI